MELPENKLVTLCDDGRPRPSARRIRDLDPVDQVRCRPAEV